LAHAYYDSPLRRGNNVIAEIRMQY